METVKRKLTIWGALAQASVLESIRRKDLYVALILSLMMFFSAAAIGAFGVKGIEIFLKDVALTVITWFSILLAILFASRQLPEEITRRTVYPLLARPIGRGDLIFGKFLGAVALSTVALLLFALVGAGALAYYKISMGAIFWQYLLFRWFSLLLVCALTLLLSLLMTPSATVTVAILLAGGASSFSNFMVMADAGNTGLTRSLLRAAYFVFPHLDLFDLSKKVSYGWPPVEAWVVRDLFTYAVLYTTVFLALAVWRFRRMAV
jgi:Cu-processing system permease protein